MKHLTIVCLLCFSLQSSAQYMVIHTTGGAKTRIALADIEKLTFDLTGVTVAVSDQSMKVAEKLKIAMAKILPNPFSPHVEYTLGAVAVVRIMVFDMQGKKVRTIQYGTMQPGKYVVNWDLRNNRGDKVVTGPYVLSVHAGDETVLENLFIVQ